MRIPPTLALAALLSVSCTHRNPNEQPLPQVPPIAVHVKNENYLDMNVALVVTGVSHRLGTVTGNSSSDFHIAWNVVESEPFTLVATPIGGTNRYVSPSLSVGEGQVVEMRIGSSLRQTSVVVHEP